ncbi:BTB/POZ domain-containing protein [Poronia punctata]|nr:BTB/POZ domain-containing protein [Poronia punctata]
MVLRKHQLEAKLKDDLELVQTGVLRDENPLDTSEEFKQLLEACRRGDLRTTQELISAGVNINGRDRFDYTPLILASLCGHYELVELLLESGALAERDTFQGERCIYNALNNKIRNLLLRYDYSKSTDPLQPWAAHISSLISKAGPKTSDITLTEGDEAFDLHKFILCARSPYFQRKLADAPETSTWRLPQSKPFEAFRIVLRYLYLGDIPKDVADAQSVHTEEEILTGIDKISRQLEMSQLWEMILSWNDRRLTRQRHQDEVYRAHQQIERVFEQNVLGHKMTVDTRKVAEVKWPRGNSIFADCILRADEDVGEDTPQPEDDKDSSAIPIGPAADPKPQNGHSEPRKSVLYPAHKAMLIRCPYFEAMFSSPFMEAQETKHLQVINFDGSPKLLEIILRYLYTEELVCPLEYALDLLYASDMLFLDKLKNRAAGLISTLGSGNSNPRADRTRGGEEAEPEVEPINVYDVIHTAWDLRVQRLEEFAARYLADRLEHYIDEPEFADLIKESAARVKNRQETDTIELLDDIRYYLGERFRLRFEDAGIEEMLDESGEIDASAVEGLASQMKDMDMADETRADPGSKNAINTYWDEDSTDDRGLAEDGVRTLDGEMAEDEFASDAINYQVLLRKIDILLENLDLDA